MNSIGRMEHTSASVAAVKRIKSQIKREKITLGDIIGEPSKDLIEKKSYMQSCEFLNDPQNIDMFEYGEKLYELRNSDPSQGRIILNDIKNLKTNGSVFDRII